MPSLLNHALRNFANGAVIDRSKTSGNTSPFKSRFEKFVRKDLGSSGCFYSRSIFIIFKANCYANLVCVRLSHSENNRPFALRGHVTSFL